MTMPIEFRSMLFAAFWKSGIALGAALCISRMLKNRSADLRRLVFSANQTLCAIDASAVHGERSAPLWRNVAGATFGVPQPDHRRKGMYGSGSNRGEKGRPRQPAASARDDQRSARWATCSSTRFTTKSRCSLTSSIVVTPSWVGAGIP